MRLIFVTTVHPRTQHISAVRAWRFAQELARRGHRLVLICPAREAADGLGQRPALADHDWRSPYILTCPNPIPPRSGRVLTLVRLLMDGGNLAPWTRAAVAAARDLIGEFHPDLVWTTFGRLEAVVAARRIARVAGCPWVLDLKDNWGLYVPSPLGRIMVWRTRGWAALTANAGFTRDLAQRWLGAEATVIYSGVDAAFLARGAELGRTSHFAINLIGSLYDPGRLATFLAGVQAWAAGLSQERRAQVRLCYLGNDLAVFAAGLVGQPPGVEVNALGWVQVQELAEYCREAGINAYLFHPGTFHHKLLELLACGRPVIAVPGERAESLDLALRTGGDLSPAANPVEVAAVLARAHARWRASVEPAAPAPFAAFGWGAQAEVLEGVLAGTLARAATGITSGVRAEAAPGGRP